MLRLHQCLSLGGAKNHLVALPDCDSEGAATDIVASYAGCCGQRCMAASVLVLVGDTGDLLDKVRPPKTACQLTESRRTEDLYRE